MRYCVYCRGFNQGKPLYCQYCGRTFDVRICSHCHHLNPQNALTCRNCGSPELSEISGQLPRWLGFLKILFRTFIILSVVGFVTNLSLFIPVFVVMGLFFVMYSLLPEEAKKIIKMLVSFLIQRVIGIKKKN